MRDELIAEVLLGIDDAVEHHRSQAVGEPLGVAEPDEGAVGEADVGDRVAAERLPDRFEVRHGGVGADVGEERRDRRPVQASTSAASDSSRAARPAASRGARSVDRKVSAKPEPHCSGAVPPTPRGSQETMSKRRLISSLKGPSLPRKSTPDPPGPPGLVISVPILASGSVAGRRANARLIVAPVGSAGSTGTSREPHSRRPPQGSHRSGAGVDVGRSGRGGVF